MAKRDDALDLDFEEALRDMLGVDDDEVADRLEELSNDELLDLSDAVTRGDAKTAKAIFAVPPEMPEPGERKEKSTQKSERRRKDQAEQDEGEELADFSVGDKVRVGDDEGTVRVPNGPGNTVGVMIKGKHRMVDRNKVDRLDEMVLGMTSLPDITRMRQLAGISEPASTTEIKIASASEEVPPTEGPQDACCIAAHAALDALMNALPGVKLADLKDIRARLNDVQMKLNESAAPKTGKARAKV